MGSLAINSMGVYSTGPSTEIHTTFVVRQGSHKAQRFTDNAFIDSSERVARKEITSDSKGAF